MSRGCRLRWLWRAPARALGRARDLYVRRMTACAGYAPSDTAFGYPVFAPAAALSRSHSAAGSDWGAGSGADEDLRELVRAASERRAEQLRTELRAVARSQSMAAALTMARIDEDAPCDDFGAGDGPGALLGARSQSCIGGDARRRARVHRKVAALV